MLVMEGQDSSVVITIRYWTSDLGIVYRCRRVFPCPSRQIPSPTQTPMHWVLGIFRLVKHTS